MSDYPGLSGCSATLLPIFTRADAENPAYAARFDDPAVDGGFILGGDQDLAMEAMAGTPLETAMAAAYRRGVVFGGTSAGDAVESRSMIFGFTDAGTPENELEQGSVLVWWGDDRDLERGLSFGSTATILDQHFYQMGRFGRLLNVVAQSDDRFAGSSALGVGVDLATGVRLIGDNRLSGVFGDSSVAVIDGETAGATHSWRGPNDTLSARNLLTHLIPAGPFSYDVSARTPFDHGQAQTYRSPGPWPAGLLHAPGPGVLLLGGGVADDPTGAVMREFVKRARVPAARGSSRCSRAIRAPARPTTTPSSTPRPRPRPAGAARSTRSSTDSTPSPSPTWPEPPACCSSVATRRRWRRRWATARFASFVRTAIAHAPVVMTDRAMTAAVGRWYSAVAEPVPSTIEAQAVAEFRAGFVKVRPGLAILPGVALEPRLTVDYRWGRLYGLTRAHPDTIALGVAATPRSRSTARRRP